MDAKERRNAIIEVLCERRYESMENLANEFNVSRRTILRDIDILSSSHSIYTQSGKHGGGVYVVDGYYLYKSYLADEELRVLEALRSRATSYELKVLEGIIRKLSKPILKKGGQT